MDKRHRAVYEGHVPEVGKPLRKPTLQRKAGNSSSTCVICESALPANQNVVVCLGTPRMIDWIGTPNALGYHAHLTCAWKEGKRFFTEDNFTHEDIKAELDRKRVKLKRNIGVAMALGNLRRARSVQQKQQAGEPTRPFADVKGTQTSKSMPCALCTRKASMVQAVRIHPTGEIAHADCAWAKGVSFETLDGITSNKITDFKFDPRKADYTSQEAIQEIRRQNTQNV